MFADAENNTHVDPALGDITLDLLAGIFGLVEILAIGSAGGTCVRSWAVRGAPVTNKRRSAHADDAEADA